MNGDGFVMVFEASNKRQFSISINGEEIQLEEFLLLGKAPNGHGQSFGKFTNRGLVPLVGMFIDSVCRAVEAIPNKEERESIEYFCLQELEKRLLKIAHR